MASVPFDQMDGFIWMNGEFVKWADAKIHVLTHGLHYASAVFEGERAYGGEIFKLTDHSERLHESARLLGFKIPYSVAEIDDACRTLLKGIRLDLAEWRRPDPRTAPSKSKAAGLYMICTMSKHAAEAKGYADAMMLDWRGQVAEATGANIFFVKDGKIHTPTPDCFLDGITRRTVIGLAKDRGFEVIERTIMPEELEGFQQCFLTGTAAEVTPVSEIGQYRFEVGEIAKTLMNDYSAAVQPKHAIAAE
ncbi:MAG: branched-chain amino acid aminotransferase [Mesorhizobium sp.]|nr:MAG: branched-chain amino acid aminotransferase [Mesorhizobium sp.]